MLVQNAKLDDIVKWDKDLWSVQAHINGKATVLLPFNDTDYTATHTETVFLRWGEDVEYAIGNAGRLQTLIVGNVPNQVVVVNDRMQKGYVYFRSELPGSNMSVVFKPAYTPIEMLEAGVFEGRYMNDCRAEFPSWFDKARTGLNANPENNKYGVVAREKLSVWQKKGWIKGDDVRGWFQWYCRYWNGRRDVVVDSEQIARWRRYGKRWHAHPSTLTSPATKQALLQWAHSPFNV